jgi:hypothetical protein
MLQGVPAFIMRVLFAALFYPTPVRQRGLRFAPPSALRGTSGGETMTTPGGAGTTHPPVLGTPASLIGSELPSYGAPALFVAKCYGMGCRGSFAT